MGQKIHPIGFRLAFNRNWASRWYANNKNFAGMLLEDIKVREYLKVRLSQAAVSRVVIERPAKNARITVYSARPGMVIGKKGEDIERLKANYGVIGVKVWVFKGEVIGKNDQPSLAPSTAPAEEPAPARKPRRTTAKTGAKRATASQA